MVRGKSVCLFFATKLQKNSIYGQKTGNFYEIIRIQFPFGVHIPSLSVPDTVAPCFVYRCRSLPPRLSENLSAAIILSWRAKSSHLTKSTGLSAAIILSWRAKSSHLTKSTGTCLEIPRLRDDRMIVSEEFSDNLPRCPPPVKTAFPALLRRLIGGGSGFDKEMRDLCKISWILFSL